MTASQQADISAAEASKLLNSCRTLSDRTAHHLKRSAAETDDIGAEVKRLSKSVSDLLENLKDQADDEDAGATLEILMRANRVLRGEGAGGDLRKLMPGKKSPSLLRMLLGKNTQPIVLRREESLKMKNEYYEFRNHVALVLTVIPTVLFLFVHRAQVLEASNTANSLTPAVMCGVHVFLVWLMYAYTALSLRENVLKLNGSDIRPWWIHHHYWSIVATILLLTLPVDSRAVNSFLGKFLNWLSCQGLVFLMQNHYQRRRLYTRIALGKSNFMDVEGGESAGGSGQAYILYPFLFGLQAGQAYLGTQVLVANYKSVLDFSGYLDTEPHDSDLRGSRGVFYCGMMFLMMATCNFRHTIITIMTKRKVAKKRKTELRNGSNVDRGVDKAE